MLLKEQTGPKYPVVAVKLLAFSVKAHRLIAVDSRFIALTCEPTIRP